MASAVPSTKVVIQVRDIHIQIMTALNMWLEDNSHKNVPLSGSLIHENTTDAGMSDTLTDAGMSVPSPFRTSRGWFDRFKKGYGLHNVKLTDEHASVHHEQLKLSLLNSCSSSRRMYQSMSSIHTRLAYSGKNKHADENFHLKARKDSTGVQGCKGPGISLPLCQCQRGLTA